MTIGEFINQRRNELGLTLEEVGNACGVGKSTVKKWETGFISNMGREKISSLSKILRVSPSVFINDNIDDYDEAVKLNHPTLTDDVITFPVIGDIAAGYDKIAVEDWSGEKIEVPRSYLKGRSYSDFICLEVKGDSMYPLYHDGDRVLILKQNAINENGDIAAIIYGNEYGTLKKVEISADKATIKLVPVNPQYMPTTIIGEDVEQCHIIGIPKLIIREV